MLPVSLDCPFLIVPSVLSNVYLHTMFNISRTLYIIYNTHGIFMPLYYSLGAHEHEEHCMHNIFLKENRHFVGQLKPRLPWLRPSSMSIINVIYRSMA